MSKRAGTAHPAVERFRAICLALPGVTEKVSHGADRLAVWLAAPLLTQELLVKQDATRFFVPPYVGHRGWVGVRLDGRPSWRVVETLVRDAHAHVAAPRARR